MELLAPAGNLDKLKTAVLYGADAVYLAGQKFSLRGASDNFSETELLEGVTFAKQNNCKTYVTLNAFLHDRDLEELPEYVRFLAQCGVDAVSGIRHAHR
ncbi:MAG TPA: U32 family peptidase, partial [Candidatus Lambdaproteobacteria bacterium]|nr:U32 family peptidase [Candidatus Lambdaproteobacteria bacterium]